MISNAQLFFLCLCQFAGLVWLFARARDAEREETHLRRIALAQNAEIEALRKDRNEWAAMSGRLAHLNNQLLAALTADDGEERRDCIEGDEWKHQ